ENSIDGPGGEDHAPQRAASLRLRNEYPVIPRMEWNRALCVGIKTFHSSGGFMKTIIMVAALMLSGLLVGGANAQGPIEQEGASTNTLAPAPAVELRLTRGRSAVFDLRNLPQTSPLRRERPEREAPEIDRIALPGAQPAPTPL